MAASAAEHQFRATVERLVGGDCREECARLAGEGRRAKLCGEGLRGRSRGLLTDPRGKGLARGK